MENDARNKVVFMTTAQEQEEIERRHLEMLAATLPEESVSYHGLIPYGGQLTASVVAEARVRQARAIQEEVRKDG